jgi:putative transcriptional regulator
MNSSNQLTGHLLIAMPRMMDPNFHQTVTYICEHSDQGTLGIIINRPLDLDLGEMLQQLSLVPDDLALSNQPILQGGPVELERGFVIHESPKEWESTLQIQDSIYVTTSQDILSALAAGKGPQRSLVALGYAGWGAGQLEAEIVENSWLNVPATNSIIFETPFQSRWEQAASLLGVDLATITPDAGHA